MHQKNCENTRDKLALLIYLVRFVCSNSLGTPKQKEAFHRMYKAETSTLKEETELKINS